MSSAKEIHVGTPTNTTRTPSTTANTVTIHFHNFETLTTVKNEPIHSPDFTCAGNIWSIALYPGGTNKAMDNMVSIHLFNQSSTHTILAEYSVTVKNTYGSDLGWGARQVFDPNNGRGMDNFETRKQLLSRSLSVLRNGTLSLVVCIQSAKAYRCQLPAAESKSELLGKPVIKQFGEENTTDVAFELGDTIFCGHRHLLEVQAPDLLELAEPFIDNKEPMPIYDVKPNIFEIMLKYVYNGQILPLEWKKHSKQILTASEKYGFTALRSEAEAWLLENMKLTTDNALDELLYAHDSHCKDIKVKVIDYIVKHALAVLASPSFPKLAESSELMTEVMMALAKLNESQRRKLGKLLSSS